MGWLAPLFLAGLAGLAVPVLLHLTRRERGSPVRFPSLMFVKQIPFEERSRRRVRHWLLLWFRIAALALLVAAFGRPFARGGRLAVAAGAGPEEIVVLLDQSYSMALGDQWAQAVARAKDLVNGMGPQDRASLVAFSESPRLLAPSSTAAAPLLQALDTLETTSLGTRIAPALKLAGSTLAASPLARRRVALISDFQRAGWQPDRDAALPEGVELETVVVGGDGAGAANLALGGLELERTAGQGRDRVTVRARVVSSRGAEREAEAGEREARVALSVDGTEVETRVVSVPAGGAAPVSLGPFTLARDFTRGAVRLSEDALAADNVVHFVASPGEGVDVLVWDPRGAGSSNLHLVGALEAGGGDGFSARVAASAPSAEQLAAADVVVVNGATMPGGAAGRLRDFVIDGGGLFVVLGERGPLAGGAAAAGRAEFLPVVAGSVADAPDEPRRLGFVDYDHPVFEPFRGPRSGDFSRTAFYRTRRVEAAAGARTLARFDDGSPALVEARLGRGRILVWAGGMDRLWTDFPLQPLYLPFVRRAASHLASRGAPAEWHPVGATVDLAVLAEAVGAPGLPAEAVAMAPGGGSAPIDRNAPLLFLGEQGIWEIRSPGRRQDPPLALAANVDVRESDLARLDMEEFVAAVAGGGAAGGALDDAQTSPEEPPSPEDVEARQGFWRYLLAGAFLVLISESVLANRLSRGRAAA